MEIVHTNLNFKFLLHPAIRILKIIMAERINFYGKYKYTGFQSFGLVTSAKIIKFKRIKRISQKKYIKLYY